MSETKETILNTELTKDNPWKMIHLLSKEVERVIDIADSRFSIGDICDLWYVVYGENMEEAHPRFVDELRQRLS
jgi:hypothetical protein